MTARRGFTLLEVVLALALSGVVILGVAWAIDYQLRAVDAARSEAEQAQLARALLRRIGDDLRNVVYYEPVDTDALVLSSTGALTAASSAAADSLGSTGLGSSTAGGLSGGGGGSATSGSSSSSGGLSRSAARSSGGGSGSGGGGGGFSSSAGGGGSSSGSTAGSGGSSSMRGGVAGAGNSSTGTGSSTGGSGSSGGTAASSDALTETSEADASAARPGLYGTATSLAVDMSRTPRADAAAMLAPLDAKGLPPPTGDVRTVRYELSLPGAPALVGPWAQPATGLVRWDADRAAARYAASFGLSTEMNAAARGIAAEVVGLEFRYFNGTEWLAEWDAEASGGLPVAVEAAVAFVSSQGRAAGLTSESFQATDLFNTLPGGDPNVRVYRLLVALPTAKPLAADAAAGTDSDSTSSGGEATPPGSTASAGSN